MFLSCRYHWIHNATAINHAYADTGLFCIHGSADPVHARNLVEIIINELVNTQFSISNVRATFSSCFKPLSQQGHLRQWYDFVCDFQDELKRAKVQLQSLLLMNLETKSVEFEDVGLQVLWHNTRKSAQEYFDAIGEHRVLGFVILSVVSGSCSCSGGKEVTLL